MRVYSIHMKGLQYGKNSYWFIVNKIWKRKTTGILSGGLCYETISMVIYVHASVYHVYTLLVNKLIQKNNNKTFLKFNWEVELFQIKPLS